ncbi:MAG TPA: GAF domain-containing protein [Thermoanaerobaculia bacterium]|nr:GAF domain-containing protein [Thermoanaerobaculia bacterium]
MTKVTTKDPTHNTYIDRVREDTQNYVRHLLSENEQLRILTAQLQSEIGIVRQELAGARDELAQRELAQRELAQALERIREESLQSLARYADVEMHNTNLANLYVASYQLHGTLRREAVLAAIQEIVVNLIGSEMFAICEIDGLDISVLATVGVGPKEISWTTPRLRQTVISGAAYVGAGGERAAGDPLVCLPLRLDGRTVGAILIFELLAHKAQLEALDHELFDLLATHAATALYCTSLHERSATVEGA